MIQKSRLKTLKNSDLQKGDYVLYWMQQSQRAANNHALAYAIDAANRQEMPLLVGFGLMDDYPEANLRHYAFMLEGLAEVETALHDAGIGFVIKKGHPRDVAIQLAKNATSMVVDRGYLRHQKSWRQDVADAVACPVVQVESDVVVPVETASNKSEYAARTLRPKLHRIWDDYLIALDERTLNHPGTELDLQSDLDLGDLDGTLDGMDIDRRVGRVDRFKGGTSSARAWLETFLETKLKGYGDNRNEPADFQCSFMSPYLHLGQVSPLEVALAAKEAGHAGDGDRASFIEELIVRRELAMNYCQFEEKYDAFESLPDWARKTMAEHEDDPRDHLYDREELEKASTHDDYWNAAMREMVETGFMHNYMRMYWAKKIIEWSPKPKEAFETTLYLNNKYFLDGRDPNSYANVGWVFGLHDRAWTEREVFGKLRYMNANGLNRKFDMDAYIKAVDDLIKAERKAAA